MRFLIKNTKTKEKLTSYQQFVDTTDIIEKIILLTGTATFIMALLWGLKHYAATSVVLAGVTFLMPFLFFINRKGYTRSAGIIYFSILAAAFTYISWLGNGIYARPFIFFPILMIATGVIFGRRAIPLSSTVIITITTILFGLDRLGYIKPYGGAVVWDVDFYVITIVILIISGAILMIVMDTIEGNIKKIVESEQAIHDAYTLTLRGWAKALELHGREPEGHSARVLEITSAFADALALSETEKEELIQGALLHDIGKMGIPDSILLKPAPLTKEEMEISRTHAYLAWRLLKVIPFPKTVMHIPLYHHEQWDGKGYPEQRTKEEIPRGARIFSIIDNWVSLTSNQVYRPAWSEDQARRYLKEEANKKFDGEITLAFLDFITPHAEEQQR